MKKLLSILFFTFITNVAMADQLAYLTYEQAEESLSFLQNEERVVLWCACCDDDAPTDVFVESVRIESVGDGYFEIILTGMTLDGESRALKRHLTLYTFTYCWKEKPIVLAP